MKITNKYNLPESVINAVTNHKHKGGFLSASQTTKSPRQFWLEKRHKNEIVEDVSDRVWALFGTACHYVFEQNPGEGISEKYFEHEIMGKTVSGSCDYYIKGKVIDYKTTSVWSIIYKSNMESWEKQLNVYAYLYRKAGYEVTSLEINAILRDWQKSKVMEDNYPKIQIQVIPIKLWSEIEQECYLKQVMKRMLDNEHIKDDDLPLCTPDELWQKPDKYAVMKEGRKSAIRLLDTHKDAQRYISYNKLDNKHYIEHRPGKAGRCDYCGGKDFCNQYRQMNGLNKKEIK